MITHQLYLVLHNGIPVHLYYNIGFLHILCATFDLRSACFASFGWLTDNSPRETNTPVTGWNEKGKQAIPYSLLRSSATLLWMVGNSEYCPEVELLLTLPCRALAFLNIGAITPLGAAPAGYAQQCPRCDNSSSEVGLHNSVTLGGVVLDMMKLWRPYDQSYFWAEPPKIMLGQRIVSST